MIYTFDTDKMANNQVTQEEYFVLLAISASNKADKTLNDVLTGVISRGLALPYINTFKVSDNGYKVLEQVSAESQNGAPSVDSLMDLAKQLREIFPRGIKAGTNTPWRESAGIISKRLIKFFGRFGQEYNDPEKILAAAKEYVDSYNGNYEFMRTLKYFIMKDEMKLNEDGKAYIDLTSDLATHMDNLGEQSTANYDNGTLLV